MNEQLRAIPERIVGLAAAALSQANMHAVFMDPGSEHWPLMSVLNTAHAGELFLKGIIAREHPLLIFKDIMNLDDSRADELDLAALLTRGRTHDFEKLPQVLWATTGIRVPNLDCYERLRRARNAIQHFCPPETGDLSELSLEFIYTIIDPLIAQHLQMHAIEYHEDHSVGYDHIVASLLRREMRFSMPADFDLTEIDMATETSDAGEPYLAWLRDELSRVGKLSLLTKV